MGTSIKYILATFGNGQFRDISDHPLLSCAEYILKDQDCSFYMNEIYATGIPQRVIWHENLGIVMHGIVFPKDISLDDFAANPDLYLREILLRHENNPQNIPYEFINGTYVGFVIDKKNGCFYAFTSFVNSFPLYYCYKDGNIVVSTDFNRLAKVCDKTLDKVTEGIVEYYHLGTNLSEHTAMDTIYSVPKGAYIKYDGTHLTRDYYYVLPPVDDRMQFKDSLEEFSHLWARNLKALDSDKYKSGLGFTGGIDSRSILAGWPRRNKLITFTGSHQFHPDYLLAKKITDKLNIAENHHLENYSETDKLWSYATMLISADNPLLLNAVTFTDQFEFRKGLGLNYELTGLTEYLGGVYHYRTRSSLVDVIRMTLPLRMHKIKNLSSSEFFELIKLGLRNDVFEEIVTKLSSGDKKSYNLLLEEIVSLLNPQINAFDCIETYLERFRHIHKMTNLLTWSRLAGRRYDELISPSLNIELTDFTAKVPLKHRENRKLLLTYLKKYHPELAGIVLTGTIFSPNVPWIIHKMINPIIKSLNALGYRIPYFQWYLKYKKAQSSLQNSSEFRRFQQSVCEDSAFLSSNILGDLYKEHRNDPKRVWRLFNIALLEKRINQSDEDYIRFIEKHYLLAKPKS